LMARVSCRRRRAVAGPLVGIFCIWYDFHIF
jgi:hypothetical protein